MNKKIESIKGEICFSALKTFGPSRELSYLLTYIQRKIDEAYELGIKNKKMKSPKQRGAI